MAVRGCKIDSNANAGLARGIAAPIHVDGSPAIWVIPTDEERQIADESLALLDQP
jgi:acetate kinase